jgi:hypothetical protein
MGGGGMMQNTVWDVVNDMISGVDPAIDELRSVEESMSTMTWAFVKYIVSLRTAISQQDAYIHILEQLLPLSEDDICELREKARVA